MEKGSEKLMNQAVSLDHFSPREYPPVHKGWHWLQVSDGLLNPVCIPAAVARGRLEGPTVLVVAGVHGDEFEGMAAIGDFFGELEVDSLCGTFVGMPVINPLAFEGQMRETPSLWDGLNLARQFPGQQTGSLTQRLAHALFAWTLRTLGSEDAFIDFHSAGTRYEYLSMVGFHPTGDQNEERSRRLAVAFGLERIWEIPDSPASRMTFNGCLARRGIPTIGTEVCGRGGMVEADVSALQAGLKNILSHKNMFKGQGASAGSGSPGAPVVWRTSMVHIQTSGLFRPCVGLDERITSEQLLGRINSATGEVLEEVRAPIAGRVWGLRRFSAVRAGEYVLLIGAQTGR